ncbi:hypothetical protein P7K49_002746 [Saguinus oedipus]|uniref:Uncharacterized protein n=1 Tax=Saguinus oedipus TaxID=9490 RepID=A0ABQ9WIQ7_SAGOE|nr:hypothetical protein P7K49_002746 [Saguinus oedipus]
MLVWGLNHNLGAASLGLALCPEPGGFRSQMSQQLGKRVGRALKKEDVSLPSDPSHHVLQGQRLLGQDWPGDSRGPARSPSCPSGPSSPKMAWTLFLRAHPRKAELRLTSSLGVRLTSKNEFEENRRRSGHTTMPNTHWPPVKILVFGVMFPEGLPSPIPIPTHLMRCWPIALAGIKWLPACRAPSREVSPPAGEGRSTGTQHGGTAQTEDAAQ